MGLVDATRQHSIQDVGPDEEDARGDARDDVRDDDDDDDDERVARE